jgi:hypothetical protein
MKLLCACERSGSTRTEGFCMSLNVRKIQEIGKNASNLEKSKNEGGCEPPTHTHRQTDTHTHTHTYTTDERIMTMTPQVCTYQSVTTAKILACHGVGDAITHVLPPNIAARTL